MFKAVKGNIVLRIEESKSRTYQAQGYDIVKVAPDGAETLVLYGAGKTVPYGEYMKAVEEAKQATAELEAFKKLFAGQAKAKGKSAAKAKK